MAIIKSGASTDTWTVDPTSKAGRITVYDAEGHEIESVIDAEGGYHLGVSVQQDVRADTANSTTANIASSATWTGTGVTSLGVAAVQINLFINQPVTVYVDQSMDGVNWDITDSWSVPASTGNSRTIQTTASYYRVRVTNNGGSGSTVTRVQTAICPIIEALPRALSSGGNLRTTIAAEWQDTSTVTGLYVASTFRTLGAASSPQNIFTIENPAASTKNVVVRDLTFTSDSTAALLTLSQQIITSKPNSLPTGGTTLTTVKYRSSYASAAAICRGGTASDGGGATAITATAGSAIHQVFVDRPATNVGWILHPTYRLLPDLGADLRQFILAPGESILVQGVTSIAATTHMIVNCSWTEYQAL